MKSRAYTYKLTNGPLNVNDSLLRFIGGDNDNESSSCCVLSSSLLLVPVPVVAVVLVDELKILVKGK